MKQAQTPPQLPEVDQFANMQDIVKILVSVVHLLQQQENTIAVLTEKVIQLETTISHSMPDL